jgi:hypothetical protein
LTQSVPPYAVKSSITLCEFKTLVISSRVLAFLSQVQGREVIWVALISEEVRVEASINACEVLIDGDHIWESYTKRSLLVYFY